MNKACHITAIKKVANGKTHISIDIKHNELMDESHINGEIALVTQHKQNDHFVFRVLGELLATWNYGEDFLVFLETNNI